MQDGGLSTGELVVAVAGGSSLGALLTLLITSVREGWRGRRLRRGRARLIHEDLYRLQSTLTRLYYGTGAEAKDSGWLLPELAVRDDYLDVLSGLRGRRLDALSSALGWASYLRGSWTRGGPMSDEDIRGMYRRFARGRWAIGWMAGLDWRNVGSWHYRPHDPDRLVPASKRSRNLDNPLQPVLRKQAKGARRG